MYDACTKEEQQHIVKSLNAIIEGCIIKQECLVQIRAGDEAPSNMTYTRLIDFYQEIEDKPNNKVYVMSDIAMANYKELFNELHAKDSNSDSVAFRIYKDYVSKHTTIKDYFENKRWKQNFSERSCYNLRLENLPDDIVQQFRYFAVSK